MSVGRTPLVAHIIFKLDFGGLENGLVNLVNRMPRDRYRHAIICLSGFGKDFRRRIQRDDVEIIAIDKQPGKDPGSYWRVWKTLRRLHPAIVHTRNLGTVDMQWVAWAAGVGHRVHGEHGWEASDPTGRNSRSLRIRRACRPVIHRYVPMSRDLAGWLEQEVRVRPERIRQLYNGVDTERFTPAVAKRGSGGEAITVGTVGRLDPVKNQAQLLQACKAIADSNPALRARLRVLIVGDGPLRQPLASLAAELGMTDQVEFAGARNDTHELLRRMDVFVLPSMNEGISNTILEAMATGLPVVAGRVGGNPELVEQDVTGYLYDPAASGALQSALLPYLLDYALRLAHGSAGRDRVVKHFRLDSMVERYLDLYDELLGNEPSPKLSPAHAGQGARRPGEDS
jgi:sugar transferase (PEP-CTERM/EpsH1 system associated)